MNTSDDTSTLDTYTVLATHPITGARFDVELVASSEHYAISRTRGTLMHRDRDAGWLGGDFEVIQVLPGVWPNRTEQDAAQA